MKVALDTTFILGRGAVKDTYNLLADGIKKLIWTLGKRIERIKPEIWTREHGLGRYFGSSIKGHTEIDWDEGKARRSFQSLSSKISAMPIPSAMHIAAS